MPVRLRSQAKPLLAPGQDLGWADLHTGGSAPRGRLRAIRRSAVALLWTLLCIPVQALLLMLPGRGKIAFARIYWAGMAAALGVAVRVLGRPAGGRVVFVSNHSSWLDIPVLGGRLPAVFIAKQDVLGWPGIGMVARLGRTITVLRRRGSVRDERDVMRERLAAGDSVVLFPEGTTSDGSRVMPFRSAFLSIVKTGVQTGADAGQVGAPWVQPVSVVYDRLGGLPTGRSSRPVFAWYGDMTIGPHFWQLAQHRGLRATVLLHPPIDPAGYADRKVLTSAVWRIVADGAATLRQNREPDLAHLASAGVGNA